MIFRWEWRDRTMFGHRVRVSLLPLSYLTCLGGAKAFPPRRNFDHRKNVKIRRVEPVLKSGHRARVSDKFEMGTWVADKLCSNLDQIEPLKCSRIESREMSEEVRRTTQQFDGKSFY